MFSLQSGATARALLNVSRASHSNSAPRGQLIPYSSYNTRGGGGGKESRKFPLCRTRSKEKCRTRTHVFLDPFPIRGVDESRPSRHIGISEENARALSSRNFALGKLRRVYLYSGNIWFIYSRGRVGDV